MKNEKETREKLLISAKQEFMEKGYSCASLRSICKHAGVTTGALYFFFKDKEELFGAIVEQPLEQLINLIKMHYEDELNDTKHTFDLNRDFHEDYQAAEMMLDYMYDYYDIFTLLLTKSQGSKYENCVETFVSMTESHCRILLDLMCEQNQVEELDDYTIHWFSHLQIFSFAQYIKHGLSREEAHKQLQFLVRFLIAGWIGLFQT